MAQQDMDSEMTVSHNDRSVAVGETYHPQFSADGDVVLHSKDGVSFRVHRVVLTAASGWFRSLFTLPQPDSGTSQLPRSHESLRVSEDATTLSILLQIICGLGFPDIPDVDTAENVLIAADKYDMPGPVSLVRKLIMHPPLITTSPLRVYSLACQWQWEEETRIASTHTLTVDLCSDDCINQLQHCGMSSRDLAKLMVLHRKRRDIIRERLNDSRLFGANARPRCTQCHFELTHTGWREFKNTVIADLEANPFGESWSTNDLWARPQIFAMLTDACTQCAKPMYSLEVTLKKLKEIIDELPQSASYPWSLIVVLTWRVRCTVVVMCLQQMLFLMHCQLSSD